MNILTMPNTILTTRSTDVTEFEIMPFIFEEMVKTAVENELVGLASNQVGFTNRFFIATVHGEFKLFVNPKYKGNTQVGEKFKWEGCGSIPNISCLVKRFESVTVTAQDSTGKIFNDVLWGSDARVFQHENDHLNGVLITSKAREKRRV